MTKFGAELFFLSLMVIILSVWGNVRDVYDIHLGNGYFDDLTRKVLEAKGNELNPLILPDIKITSTAQACLKGGHITGLISLHREGDCELESKRGRLLLKANLSAGGLDISHNVSLIIPKSPDVVVKLHYTVDYLQVAMVLSFDARTGDDGILKSIFPLRNRGMNYYPSELQKIFSEQQIQRVYDDILNNTNKATMTTLQTEFEKHVTLYPYANINNAD